MSVIYSKIIQVSKSDSEKVDKLLRGDASAEETMLPFSVGFKNDVSIDVICYREKVEVCLYDNNIEPAVRINAGTEFFKMWAIEYKNIIYMVDIVREEE